MVSLLYYKEIRGKEVNPNVDWNEDDEDVEKTTSWEEAGFSIIDMISVPIITEHVYN